jgi:DNA-binding SARP family transcriptional activator/tetratricopeptide (TPR) repeat protein
MANAPALSLALLGPPEVRVHGELARFRSRKELALLAYLCTVGGRQSRDALIVLLWPESDRVLGQAALRNTLTRVRHALGVAGSYLRVEDGAVRLDTDGPVELDLRAIETAFRADRPAVHGIPVGELAALRHAVEIYRGDFLDGFSLADAPDFDDWASRQREAWHERMERVFDRLSALHCDRGEVEAAIDVARRWISHSPLSEAAHRSLMQAHILAGDRSAALTVFGQCREVLDRELGVAPDQETEDLARRVRATAPPGPARVAGVHARVPELPFVGREAEHRTLVTAFRQAAAGEPGCVCVLGEPGIGKTRLAQTFTRWAGIQGADILTGRAIEVRGLPYQPLVAALRERFTREPAPAVSPTWRAELSRLLPELRALYPNLPLPPPTDPALAASHLFEAVAQLGEALARDRPVVLMIDDVQWADAALLDLLLYLCRRWVECGTCLLLLLTLRQEGDAPGAEIREWLVALEREIRLTRIHLSPLPAGAMRQMTRGLAGPWSADQPAADQFGDWLFAETGGQPYFAAETVKMLVEREAIRASRQPDGVWSADFAPTMQWLSEQDLPPAPASVRDVILTRLERLSAPGRALLIAAATLGRAGGLERLCGLAALEEPDALPALEEALRSRLLVPAAGTDERYAFTHDMIRQVVYAEAGPARRRTYHRRAFEGLERDGASAAELVHHAVAGNLVEPSYRYSVAAGDQAAAVYAYVEAAGHYRRALDIALSVSEEGGFPVRAGHEDLLRLFRDQGRALELASRHAEAMAVYRQMEDVARERGDRPLELAALLAQIIPLATVTAVFDPAGADRLAERALDLALALEDRAAEVDVLWSRLVIYRHTSQLERALSAGERALVLVRGLASPERLPYVLHDLGYCYSYQGRTEKARALFAEAATLWRKLGNLPMLTDSLIGACGAAVVDGGFDDALALFEEAMSLAETTGGTWVRAGCRHNVGLALAQRGEVARAIDEMEEGLRLSEEASFLSPLVVIRTDLARLYDALGAPERAMEQAQMALETAETQVPILRHYPLAVIAHLCLELGRLAQAESVVKQMQMDPHAGALGIFATLRLQAEAELALAHGKYHRAAALADEAAEAARTGGGRAFLPAALDLEARTWLGLRQPEKASDSWLAAKEEAERQGSGLPLCRLLLELSAVVPDPATSRDYERAGHDLARAIADQVPPDLRQPFLERVTIGPAPAGVATASEVGSPRRAGGEPGPVPRARAGARSLDT